MARTGRPPINFDKKQFIDLVALGCNQEEICWFFRDETGKVADGYFPWKELAWTI